ncbi:MAG: HWE histidine kinase domain-containing protein [Hyphomonadaceae bacterium]|nr:HWE histidine kinase domain-containing protein [Hyphomonadaceae bacterium]
MSKDAAIPPRVALPDGEDLGRIFDAAPNPYLLLRADAPRFTIAAVNDAYLAATRTERAAILGRGLFDVFPDNPDDSSATGVSDLRSSLDRVLRDRAPDGMGVQKYDIPVRDGSDRFEVKYWSPVNTPVHRPDGKIDYIIHRVEDVTEFILMRERTDAEFARKIETAIARAERMEAEVLRGGAQIKEANRELKHALERLAEANEKLKDVDRLKTEQLDVALNAARLGTWALDLQSNELITSDICRRDYGWLSSAPFTYDDMLELVHPDDRERRNQKIAEAFAMRQDLEVEYRVIRPDAEIVWMLVRGRAEYGADGSPIRAMGVSLDITQRKQTEQRQRVMIAELNHRVKNTLASVQSIALQTSMTAQNPKEFVAAFDGRIQALVMAHDLLTANSWQGASLEDVVSRTLAPYAARNGVGHHVEVAGPPIRLASEAAVTLHMAFHELATNAAKYGALSAPAGSVAVAWTVDRASDPSRIEMVWTEKGGPPVTLPTRRGFGSNLLQTGLAREFGGKVNLKFEPEGLVCEMRFTASSKFEAL